MPKTRCPSSEKPGMSPGRLAAGCLLGLLLTLLLTLGAALLLQKELLPLTACAWLGPAIFAVSAFACVLFSANHNGKKMLCGILSAGLYGLSLMIGCMLAFSQPMCSERIIVSVAAMLVGTVVGVVLSAVRE